MGKRKFYQDDSSDINKLVLITYNSDKEIQWYIKGMTSLTIGKSSMENEVDVNLGTTMYSDYVSSEHAVLNYSKGYWYIEDLNSLNGVGIKKVGQELALRIKPDTLYKIDKDDIIYIAKAKLIVK